MFFFRKSAYRQLDDQELIRRYREQASGDLFAVIYERYGHLVMGVCLKYLKDEQDAEDLCSKFFEELGARICKHEITFFKSWLYQSVKNECLMYLRRNRPYFVSADLLAGETTDDNDQAAQLELKATLVHEAIAQLNEHQAACIRLFYLDDLSYVDIAHKLQLDLKLVKSYIQNGKRNLKIILSQHQEFHENQIR